MLKITTAGTGQFSHAFTCLATDGRTVKYLQLESPKHPLSSEEDGMPRE